MRKPDNPILRRWLLSCTVVALLSGPVAAAEAQRIALGVSGMLLGLRNPAWTAKQLSPPVVTPVIKARPSKLLEASRLNWPIPRYLGRSRRASRRVYYPGVVTWPPAPPLLLWGDS